MAKNKKKRKATAWNAKFGQIAQECFQSTNTMSRAGSPAKSGYGACMRVELKAAAKKKGRATGPNSIAANRLKGMTAMRKSKKK